MVHGYIKTNVSGVWVCDGTKQGRSDPCKSGLVIMGRGKSKDIDSWREIGKERKKDAGKIGGRWNMLFLEIGS